MLKVDSINFRYGNGGLVLNGATLELEQGQIGIVHFADFGFVYRSFVLTQCGGTFRHGHRRCLDGCDYGAAVLRYRCRPVRCGGLELW